MSAAGAPAGRTPETATCIPGRIGVVGLGLIGGSFARAWHEAGFEVFAWNRTRDILDLARIDVVDGELTDDVLPTCELVVLTTYPEHSVQWLRDRAHLVSPGALVIDACGVKRTVCDQCWEIAAGRPWTFVGAHPMAGTQHSGYARSRADMFQGAPMVLCPSPDLKHLDRLELLSRLVGLLRPVGFGRFSVTTPEEHDRLIAHTSQLAHVVSNAYVKSPAAQEHRGYSAGSWRDLTRVADLNAPMWTELFLENRDNLVAELELVIGHLSEYRDALQDADAERLERLLQEGTDLKRRADLPHPKEA